MKIDRKLWSDDKTEEEIEHSAKNDSDNVIFNLLEDIRCLKEDPQKRACKDYDELSKRINLADSIISKITPANANQRQLIASYKTFTKK